MEGHPADSESKNGHGRNDEDAQRLEELLCQYDESLRQGDSAEWWASAASAAESEEFFEVKDVIDLMHRVWKCDDTSAGGASDTAGEIAARDPTKPVTGDHSS